MSDKLTPYQVSRKRFSAEGKAINKKQFRGVTIDYIQDSSSGTVNVFDANHTHTQTPTASLTIPQEVRGEISNLGPDVKIVAIAYKDNALFPQDEGAAFQSNKWSVNSHILSAEIRNQKLRNLAKPIKIRFLTFNSSVGIGDRRCVYWDVSKQGTYLVSIVSFWCN